MVYYVKEIYTVGIAALNYLKSMGNENMAFKNQTLKEI